MDGIFLKKYLYGMAKKDLNSSTMVGGNFENYNFYYVYYDNMKMWRTVNENIFPDFPRLFHQKFEFSPTFSGFRWLL